MRRRRHTNSWIAPLVVFSLIFLFTAFMVYTWDIPSPEYQVERLLPQSIFLGQNVPEPTSP